MDTDKDIPPKGILSIANDPVPPEGTEGEIIEGDEPEDDEPDTEDDNEEND